MSRTKTIIAWHAKRIGAANINLPLVRRRTNSLTKAIHNSTIMAEKFQEPINLTQKRQVPFLLLLSIARDTDYHYVNYITVNWISELILSGIVLPYESRHR